MKDSNCYSKYVKRILDVVLSVIALLAISPIFLAVAVLIKAKLGSPIIFRQARPGMNESIFYLYKFRSMTNEVDENGKLLPDTQRLTHLGKFLRASSLDELPELVNILKGDMSIIGPRPLSIYYLPHYPAEYRKRHEVRPGLTGLAQVNGRNNLPWDERFALDVEYVKKLSFKLDVKIICDTVLKVLEHSDIAVRGTTKIKDYGPYCILKEENFRGEPKIGMTYSEIGSYFWLDGNEIDSDESEALTSITGWLPATTDNCFTFSGRNAIAVALEDILRDHDVRRVLVPSYCCVSMLQSFIDEGLTMEFYQVKFENGQFTYVLPKADRYTVVLIMSYFGLNTYAAHQAIKRIKENDAIILEDISHSLLSKEAASEYSDYLVASLRKWFAIPAGGWVGKRHGIIKLQPSVNSNHTVEQKINGMREKYDYLTGKVRTKENFLLLQSKFENDLIHVDRMLKLDDTSMKLLYRTDIEFIKRRRRQNAIILMNGLRDMRDILSLPELDIEANTPLFLPVFLRTENRESLKKYLTERGIYCPVHWPEVMGADIGVRANELSLICDQRYTEGDMEAIVSVIHEWRSQNNN